MRWALEFPELGVACSPIDCLREPVQKFCYQQCKSIIQEGPTCGLVALCMMLDEKISVSEVFEIARAAGYTNIGEMFSCKNMANLVEIALMLTNNFNVKVELKTGGLCSDSIINKLLNKCFILIPYDSECNNMPCLRNGHRAHWALVCGIIIPSDGSEPYVIYRQGKSRHLSVWLLKNLENSNKNLYEISPRHFEENLFYVIPDGGIGGAYGLRDQYVLIEGLT